MSVSLLACFCVFGLVIGGVIPIQIEPASSIGFITKPHQFSLISRKFVIDRTDEIAFGCLKNRNTFNKSGKWRLPPSTECFGPAAARNDKIMIRDIQKSSAIFIFGPHQRTIRENFDFSKGYLSVSIEKGGQVIFFGKAQNALWKNRGRKTVMMMRTSEMTDYDTLNKRWSFSIIRNFKFSDQGVNAVNPVFLVQLKPFNDQPRPFQSGQGGFGSGLSSFKLPLHQDTLPMIDASLNTQDDQLPNANGSQNPVSNVRSGYNPLPFVLVYGMLGYFGYLLGYKIGKGRHE